jgi:hypothetical protein
MHPYLEQLSKAKILIFSSFLKQGLKNVLRFLGSPDQVKEAQNLDLLKRLRIFKHKKQMIKFSQVNTLKM